MDIYSTRRQIEWFFLKRRATEKEIQKIIKNPQFDMKDARSIASAEFKTNKCPKGNVVCHYKKKKK